MKNARDYGFIPGGDPKENACALQKAVNGGGDVYITEVGTYDIGATVVLGSHTSLHFGAGVFLRRVKPEEGELCYTFVNEGAYKREYDTDIKIEGLNLLCSGVDVSSSGKGYIDGLRGHLAFFYIKNLVIRDFACPDLLKGGFCIHICTFENALLENLRIEGLKDAVHFGRGRCFTVRHGLFRTFDDPIALNAHDYATSNPQLGWIEDGVIEDCYDLDQEHTTGFFCRILAGSWGDWKAGMQVQHSDTVVHNGRLYRVIMRPDREVYTSVTPPTHEKGSAVYDGINWVMVQEDVIYNCGCRNIHFKDIFLCKKRNIAFSIHFDDDHWSRSVYPDSKMPVQENLVFENICYQNEIDRLLYTVSPVDSVKVIGGTVDSSYFQFTSLPREGLTYPKSALTLVGVTLKGETKHLVHAAENREVDLRIIGSVYDGGEMKVSPSVNIVSSDIPLSK